MGAEEEDIGLAARILKQSRKTTAMADAGGNLPVASSMGFALNGGPTQGNKKQKSK